MLVLPQAAQVPQENPVREGGGRKKGELGGCENKGEDGAGGVRLQENCHVFKVLCGLWMPSKRKNHGVQLPAAALSMSVNLAL